MPRTSTSKTRAPAARSQAARPAEKAEPREPLPSVRAMLALARLDRRDHVAVLGEGGLDTALALWKAGFVHVDVAPERLNRPAFGTADAVIVGAGTEHFRKAVEAARGVLRMGGWLIVRVQRSAAEGIESVRRGLAEAGFVPGPGLIEEGGAWIAARRRPELTVHENALKTRTA